MLLNCGVGEDPWESLGLQGDPTSPFWRRSALGVHWKDWCWSWNSNILATWCKQLTHWKRPWCWERLKAGGEGDDRGWDGWMASPTWWTWVWASSRSWWWTGRPGMLQSMGSQRVGHDWTELIQWKISLCWGMFPCKFEVYVQYKYRHLVCVCVCVCVFSGFWLFVTPWTAAHQASLCMEFSRQHWSRRPFPPPGDLPNLGIEPVSLAPPVLAGGSLPLC